MGAKFKHDIGTAGANAEYAAHEGLAAIAEEVSG